LCGSFARALAGDYAAVTYDPRGIGNSSRAGTAEDVTPTHQADDGALPAVRARRRAGHLFGSSA
jgi:hypothetical protein